MRTAAGERAEDGSMWQATMPSDEVVRGAPLEADLDVDVAVVGAGLTGWWTAYHLASLDPSMRIAVIERHFVGFGASGRNGGWCSGLLANGLETLADRHGREAAIAMQRVMHRAVDDVVRIVVEEGGASWIAKGGTVTAARNEAQQMRLEDELAEARHFGFGPDDLRWLDAEELAARCRMTSSLGGLFTPHCAAVHPLRLVHLLARAACRRGVVLHDDTEVLDVSPGGLTTTGGRVRATVVVLATEAWRATTPTPPDDRRDVVPLYSLMVGTEKLRPDQWAEIGLEERATFHDGRRLIVYGQRTADGRLAFGGRGAPYHFGSRVEARFDTDERVREMLIEALRDLFPVVADVDVPYHWGGPLGVPRDWQWTASFDRARGLAWAGGYVGDGVSTAYVAGRTLADLITGRSTELTALPWADHHGRRWEREPLRWLGINLGRAVAARVDAAERGDGRLATTRARAWDRALGVLTGR